MKIIKPTYEIIEQGCSYKSNNSLLIDMFKHIEKCARTCYKSEDRITETSYEKMIDMLTKAKHTAMLEHGTIYLTIPLGSPITDPKYMAKIDIINFFKKNSYSKVIFKTINVSTDMNVEGNSFTNNASIETYYITTNWRVITDNNDLKIFNDMHNWHIDTANLSDSIVQWITHPTKNHEKRYTVKFTYHLAVARDVNRHRAQSPAEESTRYCNYSKDKFGKELNIIEPVWFTPLAKSRINSDNQWSLKTMCKLIAEGRENEMDSIDMWRFVNLACEFGYMYNTSNYGWTPQQASLMLPLDTKTESVHTAFASDWCHFFNLRALGTTGAPRPSAKEVAWPLMEEFLSKGYITIDMIDKDRYEEIKSKYPNIEDYIKL